MKLKMHIEENGKVELKLGAVSQGAAGGSYNILSDKPQINGQILKGNQTSEELGILSLVEKETKFNFPNIGKKNTLYLDKQNENLYWWDDEKNIYRLTNVDYREVSVINGGNAE